VSCHGDREGPLAGAFCEAAALFFNYGGSPVREEDSPVVKESGCEIFLEKYIMACSPEENSTEELEGLFC
jgi:hypothetical protein